LIPIRIPIRGAHSPLLRSSTQPPIGWNTARKFDKALGQTGPGQTASFLSANIWSNIFIRAYITHASIDEFSAACQETFPCYINKLTMSQIELFKSVPFINLKAHDHSTPAPVPPGRVIPIDFLMMFL
jgi:hypothetical protein